MTRSPLRTVRSHPDLPIYIFIAVSILIGVFTFRTYGMSWDEPLFYRYAEAIPNAYSITARLDGTFILEDAYGPSSDHGRYGPAYLLIARWPVLALKSLPSVDEAAAWHLVNFLTFQLGVYVFYLLLKRWVSPLAAFGTAALLAAQPVLWGHAFMNPKDMPFMVFFILSVYTGFRMVDAAREATQLEDISSSAWRRAEQILLALLILSAVAAFALIAFPAPIAQIARETLTLAYTDLTSLPGQLFSLLTVNARNAPLDMYLIKMDRLLAQLTTALILVLLALGLVLTAVRFARPHIERARRWLHLDLPIPALVFAALIIGLTTSVRILGPLAGLIVALYFLLRWRQRALGALVLYGVIAFAVCYATWPYLWGAPIDQFLTVLARNADNPERVRMVFAGQVTYSDEIPLSYMPTMLGWTLTEPVWPLAMGGLGVAAYFLLKKRVDWRSYLPVTLWLLIPLGYIFASRPPLYDGFRHFTFMIPGIFVLIAPGLDVILGALRKPLIRTGLVFILLLPGFIGYAQLHPYEYTYYNAYAGGTGGVFRAYETDYWLTCYKEAFEYITAHPEKPAFVMRNLLLARYYAREGLTVNFPDETAPLPSGSLLLLTTRTNGDQLTLPDAPVVLQVERDGAVFCVIKEMP